MLQRPNFGGSPIFLFLHGRRVEPHLKTANFEFSIVQTRCRLERGLATLSLKCYNLALAEGE